MTVLLKAADLFKRPVVTLSGEAIAQIKDVLYASHTGELSGFTLNGRGLFAGPLRKTLPWANVHGLGPAAVMVRDEKSLADRKALRGETEGAGGTVLGSAVITQSGRHLGVVTDLILAVGATMTDAVGYEIDPADASAPRRQFVPLPDTLSVSGEALMVPDAATDFIRDDLAGFGAAVEEFRSRLRGQTPVAEPEPAPSSSIEPAAAESSDADSLVAEPTDPDSPAAEPPATEPPTAVTEAQATTDSLSTDRPPTADRPVTQKLPVAEPPQEK